MLKKSAFIGKTHQVVIANLDKILGIIPIIGFILVYYLIGIDFAIRSFVFVIPIILSSVFIMKYKNDINIIQNLNINPTQSKNEQKLNLLLLNFLLGLISLCILFSSESRTLGYFIILVLMGGNLLLQILTEGHINKILYFIQLSFIQISLAYSLTLKYPFYYGYGDIIAHLKWIELISQNYHISPQFGYSTYYNFPVYHLYFAMSNILMGIYSKEGTFIVSGLLMPVTSIIVYQIAHGLTKNDNLAVLTSLFFAFSREIIFYNAYMITRSFALILMMYILYLLISSKNHSNKKVLLLILTFTFILTHQTTMIHASFILFILAISFWKFNISKDKLKNYYILYLVGYLGYWFYVADGFIKRVILRLKSEVELVGENSITTVTTSSTYSLPSEIVYVLNRIDLMALIFIISVLTYLYIVKPEFFIKLHYILIPSLFFSAFYFPNPALMFVESTHLLLVYRLPLLLSIFVSLLSAVGLLIIFKSSPKKRNVIAYCYIVFVLFASFSIINEMNSSDNQLVSSVYDTSKRYYTHEELNSYYFIKNNLANKKVYTDLESYMILKHYLDIDAHPLNVHFFNPSYNDVIDVNSCVLLKIKEMSNNYIKLEADTKGFGMITEKYKYNPEEGDINKIGENNSNLRRKRLIYNSGVNIYI